MKESSVCLTTPMIRTILDGKQNRLYCTVSHGFSQLWEHPYYPTGKVITHSGSAPAAWMEFRSKAQGESDAGPYLVPCPFGGVGDRIWAGESWMETRDAMGAVVQYAATPHFSYRIPLESLPRDQALSVGQAAPDTGYLPASAMPRYAARIVLDITGIGVAESLSAPRLQGACAIQQQASELNSWVWVIDVKRVPAHF